MDSFNHLNSSVFINSFFMPHPSCSLIWHSTMTTQ